MELPFDTATRACQLSLAACSGFCRVPTYPHPLTKWSIFKRVMEAIEICRNGIWRQVFPRDDWRERQNTVIGSPNSTAFYGDGNNTRERGRAEILKGCKMTLYGKQISEGLCSLRKLTRKWDIHESREAKACRQTTCWRRIPPRMTIVKKKQNADLMDETSNKKRWRMRNKRDWKRIGQTVEEGS